MGSGSLSLLDRLPVDLCFFSTRTFHRDVGLYHLFQTGTENASLHASFSARFALARPARWWHTWVINLEKSSLAKETRKRVGRRNRQGSGRPEAFPGPG